MNVYRTDDPQGEHMSPPARKEGNTIGLIGFILSLTCCLSPVGLLLSFIGLFKAPRGFAVAGTIIGAVFSIPHALLFVGPMLTPETAKLQSAINQDATFLKMTADRYNNETGQHPVVLADMILAPGIDTDPWGNPYQVSIDSSTGEMTLTTLGPDGVLGTPDDWSGTVSDGLFNTIVIDETTLTQWVATDTHDLSSDVFGTIKWAIENASQSVVKNPPATPISPDPTSTPDASEMPEAPESTEDLPS